ncbi:hypothetical protein HZH66_012101 [Vespula vulgaris]|uniref:Uncharacterized protein n=1 Tax=Vespula vulgaris TaxID=7454 RepID=A0A834JBI8_VESVU|nr:hypothetical protein HZH66_012101 [Vespula vulgaris]
MERGNNELITSSRRIEYIGTVSLWWVTKGSFQSPRTRWGCYRGFRGPRSNLRSTLQEAEIGSQREVGKGLEEGGRGQDVMPPLGAALMGIWASEAYSFYPVSASRFLSILFHNTLGDVYVLQDARKIRSRLHSDIRRFMMRRIREAR